MDAIQIIFKVCVMLFSGGMTVYSIYDAFGGGSIGLVFGVFAVFLFEGAAIYWEWAAKVGKEGQWIVAAICMFLSMLFSVASTIVGISLLTPWGADVRAALPLGMIMIGILGSGMFTTMFGFVAWGMANPDALRDNIQQLIDGVQTTMELNGQKLVLKESERELNIVLKAEAREMGRKNADVVMKRLKGSVLKELAAPKNEITPTNQQPSRPVSAQPWQVMNPATLAQGGGSAPRSPLHHRPQRIPMSDTDEDKPHPSAYNTDGGADDVDVQHAPLAPKGAPRVTGTAYDPVTGQVMTRQVPTPRQFNQRMNE